MTIARDNAVKIENNAIYVFNKASADYAAITDSLQVTILSLNKYIGEMGICINDETGISASAEGKRKRNQDALDHAIDMCSAYDTEYTNSTKARNDEIALLSKLKTFVREQEQIFGNFGNDKVNAFDEYKKSFAETQSQSRANFLQVTLQKYNSRDRTAEVAPAKCESCRKSFLQKKLGF